MGKKRKDIQETSPNEATTFHTRRARTPDGRENQMIQLAINKVEERMLNGTASAQEYIHYLKLGASRKTQKLEEEKLALELELVKAKTEALKSSQMNQKLFEEAIRQMTIYQGRGNDEDYF